MVGRAPLALWPSVGDLPEPHSQADQECGVKTVINVLAQGESLNGPLPP